MLTYIKEAFEVLQDRDTYTQKIGEDAYASRVIGGQLILMSVFLFFYGVVMGSYNSWQQAFVSGFKLWLLLMITLLICLPSFYIVQLVLGSKVSLRQILIIILSGFVLTTTIMLAFAPIVLFFQLSGDNYAFLQLIHVFVFIFSGFFGMRVVAEAMKNAFEEKKVYPKIGLSVFRIWVVIFAFVGLQLSWNLRPFVGTKDMPFQIFRSDTQGNVYSTLLRSVGHMMGIVPDKEEEASNAAPEPQAPTQPQPEEPTPVAEEESITRTAIPPQDTLNASETPNQ